MATIRAYTTIEQSRKLAEILPLESADMCYINGDSGKISIGEWENNVHDEDDIPCWSLAALIGVLPEKYYPIKDHETNLILGKPKDKWCVLYWDTMGMQDGEQTLADNPVDACYEMILKLHELNLL